MVRRGHNTKHQAGLSRNHALSGLAIPLRLLHLSRGSLCRVASRRGCGARSLRIPVACSPHSRHRGSPGALLPAHELARRRGWPCGLVRRQDILQLDRDGACRPKRRAPCESMAPTAAPHTPQPGCGARWSFALLLWVQGRGACRAICEGPPQQGCALRLDISLSADMTSS